MTQVQLDLDPFPGSINLKETALIIIDMQRDFLEPGGFAEKLGNDVSHLDKAVKPCKAVLEAAREAGMLIIHTREGHRPGGVNLHPNKKQRFGTTKPVIGTPGPKGKILIIGEEGHDIIPELYPREGEAVIDKPGKGSFYATDLECILRANGIATLLVCGVTTEVCVHTTIREANDRGFHCIIIPDACGSFFPEFHDTAVKMVVAQHGIFGSAIPSSKLVEALHSKNDEKKE